MSVISSSRFFSASPLLLLVVATGCSGTYDASVSGTVTFDGSPLKSGSISFIPGQPGPASYAAVLGDGSYTVNTGREEGLPPGSYTITVMAREKSIEDTSGRGLPPMPGKQITPTWYAQKKSSPLKFTVEAGSNEINLELTSDPPPDWNPPKRRKR
ncbi:MAG: carboxypeptidase-like regulatory domain-containing protein [Planctomycetota bacterium]